MSAIENAQVVEHPSLLAALAAFGGEDGLTFAKTKTAKVVLKAGGSYTYRYADLGDILPAVRPLLSKLGLSWTSKPAQTDGGAMVLRFALCHASGETNAGEIPLGVPAGCKPQELGSAITYARRYAITAQLNLATEEDDAANAAQGAEPASRPAMKEATPPVLPLSDDGLRIVLEAITTSKPGTERLRGKLVALGVQDVPAGQIVEATLRAMTEGQALEVVKWCSESMEQWTAERVRAAAAAHPSEKKS